MWRKRQRTQGIWFVHYLLLETLQKEATQTGGLVHNARGGQTIQVGLYLLHNKPKRT